MIFMSWSIERSKLILRLVFSRVFDVRGNLGFEPSNNLRKKLHLRYLAGSWIRCPDSSPTDISPSDTSPKDTSPTDTFPTDKSPTDIFPTRHFPDGHFPDGHFPDGHFPDGHFPDQTDPWRTLPQADKFFLFLVRL